MIRLIRRLTRRLASMDDREALADRCSKRLERLGIPA